MMESITRPCVLHLARKIFFGNPDHFIRKTLYLLHLKESNVSPHIRGEYDFQRAMAHMAHGSPRIRREYLTRTDGVQSPAGSPPHTRGIQKGGLNMELQFGLTPAYAGNTSRGVV